MVHVCVLKIRITTERRTSDSFSHCVSAVDICPSRAVGRRTRVRPTRPRCSTLRQCFLHVQVCS